MSFKINIISSVSIIIVDAILVEAISNSRNYIQLNLSSVKLIAI